MIVWCWVDNSWKFLQQKTCIGVAKWVLVLCCCSIYARGVFSLLVCGSQRLLLTLFFQIFVLCYNILVKAEFQLSITAPKSCSEMCAYCSASFPVCCCRSMHDPCSVLSVRFCYKKWLGSARDARVLDRVNIPLGINRCTTALGGWGAHLVNRYLLRELNFL